MDEEVKKQEPPKSKSVLEETKEAIEVLKQEREEMTKIKEEIQQLRSDQLLSGTAGIRQPENEKRELTPKEYKARASILFISSGLMFITGQRPHL